MYPTADRYGMQHLEFRVDNDQRLRINDAPVFPLDITQPVHIDIAASQVRTSDLHRSKPVPVGFALGISPQSLNDEEPDKKLIRAKFTILDLNGTPVQVDTVEINLLLLATESGSSLHIVKISTAPFDESPGASACAGSPKWSLCRLRAIIMSQLQELFNGAKARAKAMHGWMEKPGCHGKKVYKHEGHEDHEGKHRWHTHHKGHRAFHRIGHTLHQAIRFFIVPALLGVIGGLMASAVGMLVGQIIVYLWFHFHRNGQRGQIRMVEVAVAEDEKEALMELPPRYEDVDTVTVEDEKK
jgi:hypothetical protein